MAQGDVPGFRKCRNSACGCTVRADETYCSERCENNASNPISAGQGCQCGHTDCTRGKPPAA